MTNLAQQATTLDVGAFRDGLDHLSHELVKLDFMIRRYVARMRLKQHVPAGAAEHHRHLYIADEEVDTLLASGGDAAAKPIDLSLIDQAIADQDHAIAAALAQSAGRDIDCRLERLAILFNFAPIERQALIICLAPELRAKYDRLYAYLQNDITRKKPTVDLVLNLSCDSELERWRARPLFDDSGTLFRADILQAIEDVQSPSGSSGLARCLKLDPRVLSYLLGHAVPDARLRDVFRVHDPALSPGQLAADPAVQERLSRLIASRANSTVGDKPLFIHLHGPPGVGKRELAVAGSRQLGCLLLEVDLEALMLQDREAKTLLRLAFRESLFFQAPLYLSGIDVLGGEDGKARLLAKALGRIIQDFGWITYGAGERPWRPHDLTRFARFHSIEMPLPSVSIRDLVWRRAMERLWPEASQIPTDSLARRFRLTPGWISDAITAARQEHELAGDGAAPKSSDLAAACRNQSNQRLGDLAAKIEPRYGWDDIVLPLDTQDLLREISAQVRHRHRVLTEWGFEQKLVYGTGLSALFSGPPGTGKTMAAQVIARDLEVDLYKIDLANVVSKYIGETEKNLGRIFDEAETSNAVLFFDEADALFGKRTEVSDAHDRYANIEVSYLLQKMEEYSGIVVLATNFRNNMDDAFIRRIRFIVDFPFPDEASRRRIWKVHFPATAPVSDDMDFDLLGKEINVAGGNIKNIVLNAAFRAADGGSGIDMRHIIESTKREFCKIGKLWSGDSFAKYETNHEMGDRA